VGQLIKSGRQLAVGQWLFQHRCFMPAFFALLFIPALNHFQFPQNSHLLQIYWELVCLGISLLGLAVRVMTVAYISEPSSGRELSTPKAEHLNTTGIYSLVRHPLYIGNLIIWLGVVSMMRLWWLSLAIILLSLGYHRLIIGAEESYLGNRFGQVYLEWAQKTPALIPSFRNWAPPEYPFSMAMVLRREYSGLFQVIAVFCFMNAALNYVQLDVWAIDLIFRYLLAATVLICGPIWYIVKRTSWLPAPDRNLPNHSVSPLSSEKH
jgi:protein-S-isoprenylcysteine O-methyltransferase Ste14